jgi:hypothetical protein
MASRPTYWKCRCRCCGRLFLASRHDKKTCRAACRKGYSRFKTGEDPHPCGGRCKPEYDQPATIFIPGHSKPADDQTAGDV